MGIMNAPMMLAASSGDDVDFMVHGLILLQGCAFKWKKSCNIKGEIFRYKKRICLLQR